MFRFHVLGDSGLVLGIVALDCKYWLHNLLTTCLLPTSSDQKSVFILTKTVQLSRLYIYTDKNSVRDILYNTDVTSHIVKLIVHSPVGKLV